jgi:hypothetical protein
MKRSPLALMDISDFNALHSGKHNEEVQLCAFDVLAMDGDALASDRDWQYRLVAA